MAAKHIPSVFAVNKYLWKQIEAQGILTKDSYNGLTPIIPIQESAQFIQAMDAVAGVGAYPYIVYSWYTNSIDADSWYQQTDTVIYTIYSTDQTKLRQLVLLFLNLLKRFDMTADRINDFIYDPDNALGSEYTAYNYKTIWVAASNAGTPSGYENDPNQATITVRVKYTNDGNDDPLP